MTAQLNFDKANEQRLLPLLEWLREIGLVKSYQVADPAAVDGDVFLNRMLENAEKDISEGNLMTSDEVTQKLENWQDFLIKKDKTGILSQLPKDQIANLLHQAIKRMQALGMIPQKTPNGVLIALAAILYDQEILSSGQAADFAGLPKADFIRQMGKYRVSAFGESQEEISAL